MSVGTGARNNLGPHKVMTYINGAEGFSTKNIFEFKVSEMALQLFFPKRNIIFLGSKER